MENRVLILLLLPAIVVSFVRVSWAADTCENLFSRLDDVAENVLRADDVQTLTRRLENVWSFLSKHPARADVSFDPLFLDFIRNGEFADPAEAGWAGLILALVAPKHNLEAAQLRMLFGLSAPGNSLLKKELNRALAGYDLADVFEKSREFCQRTGCTQSDSYYFEVLLKLRGQSAPAAKSRPRYDAAGRRNRDVEQPRNDSATVERLVKENQGLIYMVLNHTRLLAIARARRVDVDDLTQAGQIGLFKAARLYNPGIGPFSTYATRSIRTAMVRELHGGRPDKETPLNNHLGTLSLSHRYHQNNEAGTSGLSFHDILPSDADWSSPEVMVMRDHDRVSNLRPFRTFRILLSAREKSIYDARIVPRDNDSWLSLDELADQWSLSKERIRQIEKFLMQRLEDYRLGEDLSKKRIENTARLPRLVRDDLKDPANITLLKRYRATRDEQYQELFDRIIESLTSGAPVDAAEVSRETGIPADRVHHLVDRMRIRMKAVLTGQE